MNVDVMDFLPCDDAVRLNDVETIELEGRFERTCNAVNGSEYRSGERFRHVGHSLVVCFRDDERMPACTGFDIEECERPLVLVQPIRRRIPGDNRTERAL